MLRYFMIFGVLIALIASAFYVMYKYPEYMPNAQPVPAADHHDHEEDVVQQQVKLSNQALKNLKLVSKSVWPVNYWRTIEIPGTVVDRPGISDRNIVAPVTAVVTAIHHFAGDSLTVGKPLFTLRLVGESFQTSQTELFKSTKESEIIQEQLDRLDEFIKSGSIPGSRILELKNEQRRLAVSIQAHRQDLQLRGLTTEQIDQVTRGKLVSEVVVNVPPLWYEQSGDSLEIELQKVCVEIGQHVQAGDRLAVLSRHDSLFIEGKAFLQELPLLQRAAEESWTIKVELLESSEFSWGTPIEPVHIHHISNTLNEDQRTVSFYLPLSNQSRSYTRDGSQHYLWRFRPGQRVQLQVQVEQLNNVFVLPASALVTEGPENYVFQRTGIKFDRKSVHVLHRTSSTVVIANDGSVPKGNHVAMNGAIQLNRILKSQSSTVTPGVHVHADGSVHQNH